MLELAGETKIITLEPFSDDPVKTEFTVTTANPVEWAILNGSIEAKQRAVQQTGKKADSLEVTAAAVEALCVGLSGYVSKIRNAETVDDEITGIANISTYMQKRMKPWQLERLRDIINGLMSISPYEVKASGSRLDLGPSTSEPLTENPA